MSTNADILRYIDSISRDKEIDKESLFVSIEQAVAQALSKKYGIDDLEIGLDRESGQWVCNYEVSLADQGRILAQTVKQAIITKVREAERDVLYGEFEQKIGEIVNGTIHRFEGDTVIVNLGRNMEGILPRAEKVRSESYNVGERIRAMVLEVKKVGPRLKIILSRSHRDLVRALFELEVPEISDGTIQIRRIEREPGYRTKLAVDSTDDKVDCVGACVGVRGNRIKGIIDELYGERIDIIRWNDDAQMLIGNALKPAEIAYIELDQANRKALVLVNEDQQSLAIGRKGQNVRLASKLTGWDIDIMTRAQLERTVHEEDEAETGEGTAAAGKPAGGEAAAAATPTDDATGTTAATPTDDATIEVEATPTDDATVEVEAAAAKDQTTAAPATAGEDAGDSAGETSDTTDNAKVQEHD